MIFFVLALADLSAACSCVAPANDLRVHSVAGLKTKPTWFVVSRAQGGEAFNTACSTSPLVVEEFALWDVTTGRMRCLTDEDRALERDPAAIVNAAVQSTFDVQFVADSQNGPNVTAGGVLNVTLGSQTITTTLPAGAVAFPSVAALFLATPLLDSNHVVLLFSNAIRKIEVQPGNATGKETTLSLNAAASSGGSPAFAWSSRHQMLRYDSVISSCSNSGPIVQVGWTKGVVARPLSLGACGGAVVFNPANLIALSFGSAGTGGCESTPHAAVVTASGDRLDVPQSELANLLDDCSATAVPVSLRSTTAVIVALFVMTL